MSIKLQRQGHKENLYRAAGDLIVVMACWIMAFHLRFTLQVVEITKGDDQLSTYAQLIPLLCLCYVTGFTALGVYAGSLNRVRIWEENIRLARAHLFSFLIFVAAAYFLFDHRYSRYVLAFHLALVTIFLPVGRSIVRKFLRALARLRPPKALNAVVIGEGPVCDRLESLVHQRRDWHLRSCGRFSPDERTELDATLDTDTIDVAFVTTHKQNAEWVEWVFSRLGNSHAEIIYVPDFGSSTFLAPRPVQIQDLTAVVLNAPALQGYGVYAKRLFDIMFSLCFLVLFSPGFAICAILVRLSSPGPIFYRQERMGLDGKTFQCLKFRGMRVDAEDQSGPVWAKKDDDRTTPIGSWLRKTSLDEIPQFINVLKGEMSVVGPRPERPVFVKTFRTQVPGYMLRHAAKAGITGWAQINGWRGNTSLERRIECDLWYLQNWSLLLDLKICLLTPFKGLIHPNAY
jgi:exopolysaccharide biosynthesis polyprenyl glycosylphosphotransferase